MGFVQELGEALPDGTVVTDADVLESYRFDRTTWIDPGQPVAAAFPTTTEQVAAAIRTAAAHGIPVVPRGAGSSLAGAASAIDGCLVLCLERMDLILAIEPDDQLVTVEPGVLNADISAAAQPHGLWYPPDPASKEFCSIGGNVATNAGGLCCVKYGVTRDYVLGLEVVLPDGEVIETGRRTIKGVAGYDLTNLFIGSEGTLGVVTKVRARLRALPDPPATMVAFFPSLVAAGRAVAAITRSGPVLSLLEIVDHTTLVAIDDWRNMGLDRDAAALILAQSDSPESLRRIEIEQAAELCDQAGATYTATTTDADESDALLEARRLAIPALERMGPTLLDDIAVPRSRIPELMERTNEIADKRDLVIGNFGHAGDGNMHPTIVLLRGDDDALIRGREAFDDLVEAALDLGGTITGEHGVGAIKGHFLAREVGSGNLALQRRIKHAVDPEGIMNPGRWL